MARDELDILLRTLDAATASGNAAAASLAGFIRFRPDELVRNPAFMAAARLIETKGDGDVDSTELYELAGRLIEADRALHH
jgi:hypothetical protein